MTTTSAQDEARCLYCEETLPEEARFCPSCGAAASQCPVCERFVLNEANFCGACGTDLRDHDMGPNGMVRHGRTLDPRIDARVARDFQTLIAAGACAVLYRPSRATQRYPVVKGDHTIGAGPDNDIVIADEAISWNHALLLCHPPRLRIQDTASTNGTFVNGVQVMRPIDLDHGDVIRLADIDFALWLPPQART